MTWKTTFEDRLKSWVDLRSSTGVEPLAEYLQRVNEWWHQTPWSPYYLHWDDVETWPTPWDLLADNIFCPVSRGVGMLYTLALSPRGDTKDAQLLGFGNDNLVIVRRGLYVLNYSQESVVNITLPTKHTHYRLSVTDVLQRI